MSDQSSIEWTDATSPLYTSPTFDRNDACGGPAELRMTDPDAVRAMGRGMEYEPTTVKLERRIADLERELQRLTDELNRHIRGGG